MDQQAEMTRFGEEVTLSVRVQGLVQHFNGGPCVELQVFAQVDVGEHAGAKQVA